MEIQKDNFEEKKTTTKTQLKDNVKEEKSLNTQENKDDKKGETKTSAGVEEEEKEKYALTAQKLLVAGGHFGHNTRKWNPKMAKFIYTKKRNIHIINLKKTIKAFQNAYEFVKDLGANNKPIIFIGTKKQAKEIIKREALRCNAMFVAQRWLGGTLTNFKTIRKRFNRLNEIEKMEENNVFSKLPKKEVILIKKEYQKLLNNLEGIRNMRGMPSAIFVIDPLIEIHAVREANKLKIPVVSVVDTNCDPTIITFPIPGNDDAVKSIDLFVSVIADAYNEGKGIEPTIAYTEDEEIKFEGHKKGERYDSDRKNFKFRRHNRSDERHKFSRNEDNKKPYHSFKNKGEEKFGHKNYNKFKDYKKTTPDKVMEKKPSLSQEKKVEQPKMEVMEKVAPQKVVAPLKTEVKEKTAPQKEVAQPKTEVKEKTTPQKEVVKPKLDLVNMSVVELKSYAKEKGLKNYSKLKKDELLELIKKGEK